MDKFFQNMWTSILSGLAAVGGFILGLYGEWDALMTVLVYCMAVDYLSGLLVAIMGRSKKTDGGGLDSKVGFKGLLRKVIIMLVVLLAALVDKAMGSGGSAFRSMACLFYIANEGLSILENTALAGVPWPDGIKNVLEQMKDKGVEKPPDAGA